jgi:S-adenosyl methyltransferase
VLSSRYSMISSVDPSVPNAARIYDYLLGGKDNFAADRAAAEQLLRVAPDAATTVRENRRFLQRAVRYLAEEGGIRQFLDIGTGMPTQGNVHEIAQSVSPDARVCYVDYDPVVVNHALALLATNENVAAIHGDFLRPLDIFGNPELRKFIDFNEPVAILLVAILHFIDDSKSPYQLVDQFKSAMSSDSYLVISHVTDDSIPDDVSRDAQQLYKNSSAPITPRSLDEVIRFFDGLDLVEPGVVDASEWRPDLPSGELPLVPGSSPSHTLGYGGVGRKP